MHASTHPEQLGVVVGVECFEVDDGIFRDTSTHGFEKRAGRARDVEGRHVKCSAVGLRFRGDDVILKDGIAFDVLLDDGVAFLRDHLAETELVPDLLNALEVLH